MDRSLTAETQHAKAATKLNAKTLRRQDLLFFPTFAFFPTTSRNEK
jgi:hypothetical protein